MVEHLKSKSTQPRSESWWNTLTVLGVEFLSKCFNSRLEMGILGSLTVIFDSRPFPFLPGHQDACPSGDAPGTPGCIVNSITTYLLCWGNDIIDLWQRLILLPIASDPEANRTQGTENDFSITSSSLCHL